MKVFDEITYDLWPDTEKPKDDEPKEKTKTLAIATDFMTKLKSAGDLDEFNKLHWKYFQADYGKGAKCRDDTVFDETMDIDRTKAGTYYPKGTKKMKLFDQDCEYTNPGDTPGKLKCGDKEIECIDDPADKDPDDVNAEKGNYPCGDNTTRQPVFICSW
ncbi:hypothetical protein CC78DRAFT_384063 [Lojkania enalia]|uniref:Uncharacterized protein n=1 Tax=Lojkania enalia TaxID=147567 RepID=A0A9P4K6D1_9PLEO|nr:hypothetical protein CC78DRAFT_384063 [Didymosphaeria enalia]